MKRMLRASILAPALPSDLPANADTAYMSHGLVANLDMPATTMVFRVQDPAMLDQVKPGDEIRFQAERVSGAMTVTRIETVN